MTDSVRLEQTATEIIVRHTLRAPPAQVWEVFTRPEHLGAWWGPDGFTTTTEAHALRPGGQWRFTMHGPDGQDYPNLLTYVEVDAPRRLVYRHGGEAGVEPVQFTVEASFTPVGDGTEVVLRSVFPNAASKEHVVRTYGAAEGARQHLGNLARYLDTRAAAPTDGAVFHLQRVVHAPIEQVWAALTEPAHLVRWFSPDVWVLSHCEVDLRPGGSFRFTMTGEAWTSHGVWRYREVVPPERLVFTSAFADETFAITRAPFSERFPREVLSTLTLAPHAGKGGGTVITLRGEPYEATADERAFYQGMHGSMTQGWTATLDNLARHLAG